MSEENKTPDVPVSNQKRTALLRYMTILFAVAFALVLLSYLIQVRNSQTTITQLNATSASALQNAEQLQETNWELTEENERLNAELNNAADAMLEYQESAETARKAAHQEGRILGAEEGTAQTRTAYDLLMQGLAAENDKETLQKVLTELEPIKSSLSESALKQYDGLVQQYKALNGTE